MTKSRTVRNPVVRTLRCPACESRFIYDGACLIGGTPSKYLARLRQDCETLRELGEALRRVFGDGARRSRVAQQLLEIGSERRWEAARPRKGRGPQSKLPELQLSECNWYRFFQNLQIGLLSSAARETLCRSVRFSPGRRRVLIANLLTHPYCPAIPGRPELCQKLVQARTAGEVQKIAEGCLRWPGLDQGSIPQARFLSAHAKEFQRAKRHARYPRKESETGDRRRMLFLARWMAAASCGLSPETALRHLPKISWVTQFEREEPENRLALLLPNGKRSGTVQSLI